MKSKKKIVLISAVFLCLTACGSKKKNNEKKVLAADYSQQREALAAFEAANTLFDEESYASAAKAYDKIMVATPVSTLDGLIMFNSGLAHQMNDNCKLAVSRYRKVIRFSRKRKASALVLRAKLRLSDAYSCLGQADKSLVLLTEVFKQRKELNPAIGMAEVPAKLAAGYSRLGNRKMADYYFKIADRGLRMLENLNKNSKNQKKLLSKTLFTMGDTSRVKFNTKNHKTYFRTLVTLQKYLLRSISYEIEPWSMRAASQIVEAYEYSWKLVEDVKAPEGLSKARAERAIKVQRGKILQSALAGIRDLEKEKLPYDKSKQVADLMQRMGRSKLKMRNYLVAEVPGSELTQEAKKLQAPKREGRVKSDEKTILERKTKQ